MSVIPIKNKVENFPSARWLAGLQPVAEFSRRLRRERKVGTLAQ
jgi:hypothetical protein